MGAVPHAVKADDYDEGHLIPKDSAVVNNVWHTAAGKLSGQ